VHASVYDFVTRVLGREQVEGKRVLEVGALDVNGSVRPYVTSLKPAEYVGTDRRRGRRVDRQLNATRLIEAFECERFDLVLCLETLEHIQQWKTALYNMLAVLSRGGLFVMTTRSPGFPRHDHPDDHWRWTRHEWTWLGHFGELVTLDRDPEAPGLFLVFRREGMVPMPAIDQIHAISAPLLAP
jgi:SAM-dependent methyltransferase